MSKLHPKEIEQKLENEEVFATYCMFTDKGVNLRMKIARFYYNHYNVFTHIIIQIPLILIDAMDIIEYYIQSKHADS